MLTMPCSSYPNLVDTDYSSSQDTFVYQEPFEKRYLANTYATSPDYCLSNLFDTDDLFDQSFTSLEMMPSGFPTKPAPFNPTLPTGEMSAGESQSSFDHTFYQAPFGQPEQYDPSYSLDPTAIHSSEPASFSPITQSSSKTPSLCEDAQQHAQSPSLSPHLIKLESPFSPASLEEQTTPKRPLRKRGRPRLDRTDTDIHSPTSPSAKTPRTGRLPHNQVERKYREGLNSELERLRRAVPTLPNSDDGCAMGQPKPSKAMVLCSAIEYIRQIEKERDALREEVERLKQNQGQSMGWTRGNRSLDEFLMDT
jgi:hypothetical protein